MAYNEENNIGALLDSLLNQELVDCSIERIVVIASGCTDKTVEIVNQYLEKDKRINLVIQPEREGKASAVNLFLSLSNSHIMILESGDTLPEKNTIEKIVEPLKNPKIGMVGGRPIPTNRPDSFIGFAVNMLWNLHHKIALEHPKCGEIVAFRNVFDRINHYSAVDEACMESLIKQAGYELAYAPDAIVRNNGPDNLKDYITQRRRIASGHRLLLKKRKYNVATTSPIRILKIIISDLDLNIKSLIWTFCAIGLEAYCRFLGLLDYTFNNKKHFMWDMVESTKKEFKHA